MLFFGMVIQNEEDRSTIENLYHNYHRLMMYIAREILKDQEKAEDAVSQTFIKIIDNLQKFSFEDCNKTKGLNRYISEEYLLRHAQVRKSMEPGFPG